MQKNLWRLILNNVYSFVLTQPAFTFSKNKANSFVSSGMTDIA